MFEIDYRIKLMIVRNKGMTILFSPVCQVLYYLAGVQGVPPGALLLSRVPVPRLANAQGHLQEVLFTWGSPGVAQPRG